MGVPSNRRWLWLLALSGVTVAVYWTGLDNPFVYDDVLVVSRNVFIQDSRHLGRFFRGEITSTGEFRGHHRPLPMLTFYLNYRMGGEDPRGYRAVNLGLHLICGLLVFFVVRRLLRSFDPGDRPPGPRRDPMPAALVASGLFLLHPLSSISILLVWKRTTLLAVAFFLAALLAYLRLRGFGGTTPASPGRRAGLAALVVLLFVLALASKETAVTFPAVLLLLEAWPREDRSPLPRAVLAAHAVMWIIVALQLTVFFPHNISRFASAGPWPYLLAQAKVVWLYLAMVVAPWLLAAAYDVAIPTGLFDGPWALAGGVGLVLVLGGALLLRRRAPLASLATLWVLFTLAPTSSIVPGPLLVDEDRTYLPFVMIWALVGFGALALWRRGRALRLATGVAGGLVLLALSLTTVARCVTWSDPVWVWIDALRRYPGADRAQTNLCVRLSIEPKRVREAVASCGRRLERAPDDTRAAEGLGRALMLTGNPRGAASVLDRALRTAPDAVNLHRIAGLVAWTRDHPREAVQHLLRAVRGDPWDVASWVYLASAFQELGRSADARRVLVEVDGSRIPDDDVVRLALADLRRELGQLDRAESALEKLRTESPGQVGPLVSLALLASQRGDRSRALRLLETAERRAGHDAGAQLRVARAWLQLDAARAVHTLRRLLTHRPDAQNARLMLAVALLRSGRRDEACVAHRRVTAMDLASPAQLRWDRALRSACGGP